MVKDSALNVQANGLERNLGKVIGNRYAVVGYLGRGGMGVVYRAVDLKRDQDIALKVLINASPSARARRRFLREAKVAARLRHPNVVSTYGFGRVEGGFFLAMELIEGQPMSRFWRQGLPYDVLMDIAVKVLGALEAAHEASIIHRDLKPGNILLGQSEEGLVVKVLDFGLARFSEPDDLTRTGELVGTPRYMSPEQARGSRDIGSETDLYALGVILYEFLTGKLLFDAETPTAVAVKHITEPVPTPTPRRGIELAPGFEAVLLKLLAKDPKARYASAHAVRSALKPYLPLEQGRVLPSLDASDAPSGMESEAFSDDEEFYSLVEDIESGVCFRPTFVGRKDELEVLLERSRSMMGRGRGSVVFVSGETGVGKSRLIGAFKRRVGRRKRLRWLSGVERSGGGHGMSGLREVLSALFGVRHESRLDVERRIREVLARWGTPSEDEVRRLTDLLRPRNHGELWHYEPSGFGDQGEQETAAQIERELTFGLLERVLRRAASNGPLVVVLEDLHWAGNATRRFLDHLVPGLHNAPAPLLVVATYRDDSTHHASAIRELSARLRRHSQDVFTTLALRPFEPDMSRLLIERMLPASERLTERLIEQTEGNPLHVIETVRYLKDEALITLQQGTWSLGDDASRVATTLPPKLADVLLVRLRALVARYPRELALMRVVERVALIGRVVPYALLCMVFELESARASQSLVDVLDEALGVLVEAGVLRGVDGEHDDRLEFSHGLLREALCATLKGDGEVRAFHLAAAEAKETFYAGEMDVHAGELVLHYEEVGDWQSVVFWLIRAAAVARKSWELHVCEAHYRRARELIRTTPMPATLRRQVAEDLGELRLTQGRYQEALSLFDEAFECAEEAGEAEAMAQLLFLRGDVARTLERFDASEACYRECLAVSRALGFRRGVGQALLGLSKLFRVRKLLTEAHQFLNAAEEQFRSKNNLAGLAETSRQRAYVHMRAGAWPEARSHLKHALEQFETLNDKHNLAYVQRDLARLSLLEGRLRHAQIQARKALNRFETIGARYGFAKTLSVLGEIYCAQGHYKAAEDLSLKAQSIYETLATDEDTVYEAFLMGVLLTRSGKPDNARAWFSRAQAQASRKHLTFYEGLACAGLAWVSALGDAPEQVRDALHRAFPALDRETFYVPALADMYDACAECLQRHGHVAIAEACRVRASVVRALQRAKN